MYRTFAITAATVALLASYSTRAATTTWTGATSNLWSEDGNWDGGAPAAGDVARFDSGAVDCTVDVAPPSLGGLDVLGYGGTLNCLSQSITISGDVRLGGGTFVAPATVLSVGGDLRIVGCTFDANGGEVALDGTSPQVVDAPNATFYDVTVDAPGQTVTTCASLDVSHDLTVTSGSLLARAWWDTAYDHRSRAVIRTTAATPAGYSVQLAFDHAGLVGSGHSDASGDDVRIVYWDGGAWQELDRVLDHSSSWNANPTRIWFKTQAAIPANEYALAYYVYYGSATPGAPLADEGNVYLFWDDFDDEPAGPLPSDWTHSGSGTSVITDDGGNKVLDCNTTGGGALVTANASDCTDAVYEARMKIVDPTDTHYGLLFRYAEDLYTAYCGVHEPPNGNIWLWKRIGAPSWTQIGGYWYVPPPMPNQWYRWKIIMRGANLRAYWEGAYLGEANLGAGELTSGRLGVFPSYGGQVYYDEFRSRLYVDPEPVTVFTADETGMGVAVAGATAIAAPGAVDVASVSLTFSGDVANEGALTSTGDVLFDGTTVYAGTGAASLGAVHVSTGGALTVSGDLTANQQMLVDAAASTTVSSGTALAMVTGCSIEGTFVLQGGASLLLDDSAACDFKAASSFTASGIGWGAGEYVTIASQAAGEHFAFDLAGSVSVDYLELHGLATTGLVLQGSSGASTAAVENVRFRSTQAGAGSRHLHVAGTDWDGCAFVGMSFEDGAGADDPQYSVECATGTVYMEAFDTAAGCLHGDASEYENGGTVHWGPGAFALLTPGDDATDQDLRPTLTWSHAELSTGYTVEIAGNASFSPVVETGNPAGESYTIVAALDAAATYYWRVTAHNASGDASATNNPYSFTVHALPGPFMLTDPNAVDTSLTPTLQWDDAPGADSYDVRVATDAGFASLVVDETGVGASQYTIGAGVLGGGMQYYWTAVAVNASGTTDPTNNFLSFATVKPELSILSVTASNADPNVSDAITVTVTIQNTGPVDASSFDVGLYLNEASAPAPGDGADVTKPVGLLATGSAPLAITFTNVTGDALGTWQLYAVVDEGQTVGEENEDNNVEGPVSVTWHGPDLVIPKIEPSLANPNAGTGPGADVITVYVTVLNLGDRDASGAIDVGLFLNESTAPLVGNDPTTSAGGGATLQIAGGLAAGGRETLSFTGITSTVSDVWNTWAIVDNVATPGAVTEGDETNNVGGGTVVAWQPVPDLIIVSVTPYDAGTTDVNYEPLVGNLLDVAVVVRNQSSLAGAPGSLVALFGDRDAAPNPADLEDASDGPYALGPGSEVTVVFNDVAGPGAAESWNLYVLADHDEDVEESNEANNAFGPVQINWGAQVDIDVLAPDGSEVWEAGTVHEITWESCGEMGTSNVKIEYSVDDGGAWIAVAVATPNDGSFAWVVPDNRSVLCKVRVSAADDADPADESASTFAIVGPAPRANLRVTAITPSDVTPALADTISVDVTVRNAGEADAGIFFVDLFYDRSAPPLVGETGNRSEFVTSLDAGEEITVTILNVSAVSAARWSMYAVADAQDYVAESNEADNVTGPVLVGWDTPIPQLRLVTPAAQERLAQGVTYHVAWTSSLEAGATLYIELSADGGVTWQTVASEEDDDGEYAWTVPLVDSEVCRLRIGSYSGSAVDVSDEPFTIRRPLDYFGGVDCSPSLRGIEWGTIPTVGLLVLVLLVLAARHSRQHMR